VPAYHWRAEGIAVEAVQQAENTALDKMAWLSGLHTLPQPFGVVEQLERSGLVLKSELSMDSLPPAAEHMWPKTARWNIVADLGRPLVRFLQMAKSGTDTRTAPDEHKPAGHMRGHMLDSAEPQDTALQQELACKDIERPSMQDTEDTEDTGC